MTTKSKTLSRPNLASALKVSVTAAREVGKLLRRELQHEKRANAESQHDIKLELDVHSQKIIERRLRSGFPQIPLLGEEGSSGATDAEYRWVVDPIDGTVNFTYGIPHACVSIALQRRAAKPSASMYPDGYETVTGVVYDPFCDELWTAVLGHPARLNGKVARVSSRRNLAEAVVSVGFAKDPENLRTMMPYFNALVPQIRKIRMMGAAALALTYVASGRFDAYIERGIRIWDIAAGGLIVECAGGAFQREMVSEDHTYRMIACNGVIRRRLPIPAGFESQVAFGRPRG